MPLSKISQGILSQFCWNLQTQIMGCTSIIDQLLMWMHLDAILTILRWILNISWHKNGHNLVDSKDTELKFNVVAESDSHFCCFFISKWLQMCPFSTWHLSLKHLILLFFMKHKLETHSFARADGAFIPMRFNLNIKYKSLLTQLCKCMRACVCETCEYWQTRITGWGTYILHSCMYGTETKHVGDTGTCWYLTRSKNCTWARKQQPSSLTMTCNYKCSPLCRVSGQQCGAAGHRQPLRRCSVRHRLRQLCRLSH